MAAKKLQHSLDEIRVQDKRLVDALDNIEAFETRVFPIKDERAEKSRPFNTRIKGIAEEMGVSESQATASEREALILEKVKDRLFDGAQIRVGAYVIAVVEIDTMEEVKRGKGWKLKKPLKVDADGDGEEDAED